MINIKSKTETQSCPLTDHSKDKRSSTLSRNTYLDINSFVGLSIGSRAIR